MALNHSVIYTLMSDYNNAENIIKQYYAVASQKRAQKQAAVLNLSNVYQNTGHRSNHQSAGTNYPYRPA
jgi:chromosome condensin MukBEF ATPase and DNA-binding subunit MukB